MNQTIQTITERYSCRDFTGAPLTAEQVQILAKAAVAAPSAMNRQPWHILMVTDKALIDELDVEALRILSEAEDKAMFERIQSRGGKVYYNAPCMAIAASDGSAYAALDCGIVSQNLALAAYALGLGSVICGMANIPLNGPRGEELCRRLRFPEGYGFGMAVLVGEAKTGKEPHEPDMGKVTYIG